MARLEESSRAELLASTAEKEQLESKLHKAKSEEKRLSEELGAIKKENENLEDKLRKKVEWEHQDAY